MLCVSRHCGAKENNAMPHFGVLSVKVAYSSQIVYKNPSIEK